MSCYLGGHVGALLSALGARSATEESGMTGVTLAECVAIYGDEDGLRYYEEYEREREVEKSRCRVTEDHDDNSQIGSPLVNPCPHGAVVQSGSSSGTPPGDRATVGTPASTDPQVTPHHLEDTQEPPRRPNAQRRGSALFEDEEEEAASDSDDESRAADRTRGDPEGAEDNSTGEVAKHAEEASSLGDDEVLESQLDAEVGDIFVPPIGATPPWEDPRRRRIFNSPRAGRIECFFLEEDGERTKICEQGGARLRWVPRELVARHRGPAGSAELFDKFGGDEEDDDEGTANANAGRASRRRRLIPSTPKARLRRFNLSPSLTPRRFIENNTSVSSPSLAQGRAKRLKTSTTPAAKRASAEVQHKPVVVDSTLQQWRLFEYLSSASPTQWVRKNISGAADPELKRIVADGFHGLIPDEELMTIARSGRSETPVRIAALMALLPSGTAAQNKDRCGEVAASVGEELSSGSAPIDIGVVILVAICRQMSECMPIAQAKTARGLIIFTLAALVRVRVLWSVLEVPLPLGLGQATAAEASEEEILRDVRFKNASLGERLTGALLVVCGRRLMSGSGPEMRIATILPWVVVNGPKRVTSGRPSEEGEGSVAPPSEPSALFTRSDRFPENAVLHACRVMMGTGACTVSVDDAFAPTHPLQVEVYYKLLLESGCDRGALFTQLDKWGTASPPVAGSLLEIMIRDYPQQCYGSRLWEKVEDADLYRLVNRLPGSGKLGEAALRRLRPPRTWPDRVRLSPRTVEAAWDISCALTDAVLYSRALDDDSNRQEMEAALQFLVDALPALLGTGDIRPGLLLHCGGLMDPRHTKMLKTKNSPEPRPYWVILSDERLLKWYFDHNPDAEIVRYARDHSGVRPVRPLPPALFTEMSDKTRRTASEVARVFYTKLFEVWKEADVERGLHRANVLRWIFTQDYTPPEASLRCLEGCYKDALLSWLSGISLRPPAFVINRIQSLID
ncbi:hypothetical protein FOZ62_029936 [Perkinsus olseni]|uniref:Uncharacterized protein n=2 Tax=Perkinsus olseni TaxID=32597 RepID=A0A7J6TDQ7_PEROL|nr:hypothetical protein FOZ62_029936 [Perkinsus olseni]